MQESKKRKINEREFEMKLIKDCNEIKKTSSLDTFYTAGIKWTKDTNEMNKEMQWNELRNEMKYTNAMQ